MSKKVADIFANAAVPAVLCIANGGSDEADITFTKLDDATSGQNLTILSNLSETKSPITGEQLSTPDAGAETASTKTYKRKETLASFVCVANCVSCNNDIHTTAEVAEKLDNKQFFCPACGTQVTAFYDGDFADTSDVMDDEANDQDEDMNDADITDALDDEDADDVDDANTVGETGAADDSSDSEDDSTSDDGTGDDSDDTDDADSSTDDSDDNSDDDSSDDDSSDDSGDDSSDDDTSDDAGDSADADEEDEDDALDEEEENASATVTVASAIDPTGKLISIASTSNANRYEVFLGDDHIGSINKEEADANVQRVFDKVDTIRNAFSSTYWKNTAAIAKNDFSVVKAYGFRPAKIEVAFTKVLADKASAVEQEAEAKIADAIESTTDKVVASIQIAMQGLDKSVFGGPNLYKEIAKLLTNFGVEKAEDVAERFVSDFSGKYFNAVLAQAEVLRSKSPDYVKGIADTIETASYSKQRSSDDPSIFLATSALLENTQRNKKQEKVAAPVIKETASAHNPDNNRFRNAFRGYR